MGSAKLVPLPVRGGDVALLVADFPLTEREGELGRLLLRLGTLAPDAFRCSGIIYDGS